MQLEKVALVNNLALLRGETKSRKSFKASRDDVEKSCRRPFGGFASLRSQRQTMRRSYDASRTSAIHLYEASLMRHRYLWGHLHIAKHIEPQQMAAGTRETPEYSSSQAFVSDSRTQGWHCRGRVAEGLRENVDEFARPIALRMRSHVRRTVRGGFELSRWSVYRNLREGKGKSQWMVPSTVVQATTMAIASSGSRAEEKKKNEKTNINRASDCKEDVKTGEKGRNVIRPIRRMLKSHGAKGLRSKCGLSSKSNAAWFVGVFLTNFHLLPFLVRVYLHPKDGSFARYYFVKAKFVANDHSSSRLILDAETIEPLSKSTIIGTLAASVGTYS
ncbi:hypothetical protein ALC62_13250 [Cyphomyrmex costatus]|uniref:Uncharacterized protein n=1 Tax=Cyphomyrmex costatus TaxID=456900 RepID=A0A195C7S7_9HYME|nr:hypothetical protein ALC62_13250 [Cyphomyrmex costatus]